MKVLHFNKVTHRGRAITKLERAAEEHRRSRSCRLMDF